MQRRDLQQWTMASDARISAGTDIVIVDVHTCVDAFGISHILVSIFINSVPALFTAVCGWKDGFPIGISCMVMDRYSFNRVTNGGLCGCHGCDIVVLENCARGAEYFSSHAPLFCDADSAKNEVSRALAVFGISEESCAKAAPVLMGFINKSNGSFDLIMPAPDHVPEFTDWLSDKPARTVSIWDYWYCALRPLIQQGVVSPEDIMRDERLLGQCAKSNLRHFLGARGHKWRDVFKAWQEGKEYSFVRREGVAKASNDEIVPPTARPHGWQPAKGVARRTRGV